MKAATAMAMEGSGTAVSKGGVAEAVASAVEKKKSDKLIFVDPTTEATIALAPGDPSEHLICLGRQLRRVPRVLANLSEC